MPTASRATNAAVNLAPAGNVLIEGKLLSTSSGEIAHARQVAAACALARLLRSRGGGERPSPVVVALGHLGGRLHSPEPRRAHVRDPVHALEPALDLEQRRGVEDDARALVERRGGEGSCRPGRAPERPEAQVPATAPAV